MAKLTKYLGTIFVGVAAGATVGSIAAAVVLGYSLPPTVRKENALNEASALQNGLFKNQNKLDLVAVGDSVTAGYTTLAYQPGQLPRDEKEGSYSAYLSRILDAQTANGPGGRLNSYNNIAKSGDKTADLLSAIENDKNSTILANADLIVGTIGANDILQAVLIGGFPYRAIADLSSNTAPGLSTDTASLIRYVDGVGVTRDVVAGKMSGLFRPDFKTTTGPTSFNQIFKNMLTNFEQSIVELHNKAPSAEIIFNKYIYPFNRFIQNGKNITDVEYAQDPENYSKIFGMPSTVRTFKGAFNYIMTRLQEVAQKYQFVVWNDMQAAYDEIATNLVATKKVADKAAAMALLQPDKDDIHPSEFAHALTAEKLYNNVLAGQLGEATFNDPYDAVRMKVANASLGTHEPANIVADFLLKNTGEQATSPDNFFVSKAFDLLVDRFTRPVVIQVIRPDGGGLKNILSQTAYFGIYEVFAKAFNGQAVTKEEVQDAFLSSMQDFFYKKNDSFSKDALSAFIYPNAFGRIDYFDRLVNPVPMILFFQQAAMTPYYLNGGIYSFWASKLYQVDGTPTPNKDHDRDIIKTAFGFTDDQMLARGSFVDALTNYYRTTSGWMSPSWTQPGDLSALDDKSIASDIASQGQYLRDWIGIGNAFVDMYPQAFFSNYVLGGPTRQLTFAELQPDANGDFVTVAL